MFFRCVGDSYWFMCLAYSRYVTGNVTIYGNLNFCILMKSVGGWTRVQLSLIIV